MNAQLASIEEALTRAGIAYQVRGVRFYDRPEVRGAVEALRRRPRLEAVGSDLVAAILARWVETVGYEEEPRRPRATRAGSGRHRSRRCWRSSRRWCTVIPWPTRRAS